MAAKALISVTTAIGTFHRTTARTYTNIVVADVPGRGPIVLGWCGRFDLARKLWDRKRAEYSRIAIFDVATGHVIHVPGAPKWPAVTWTVYTVGAQVAGSDRFAIFDGARLVRGGFRSKAEALLEASRMTAAARTAALGR